MEKRLKLFSEEPKRLKLFSSEEIENGPEGMILHDLICQDCGQVITTSETPTHAICPNCGGKRMIFKLFPAEHIVEPDLQEKLQEEKSEKEVVRKPLFPMSPFEEKLKEFSGKTIKKEEFEKAFSESEAESLLEKKFASVEGDNYTVAPNALELQKTFSKLIISVTKTLELDPSIMNGELKREEIIDKLEEKMPEKELILLKRAHGIPVEESHNFSETEESWVEDSSIIPDLELEYNNQSFGLEQFIKILRERYPDAPDNIMDLLSQAGTIRIDGTQVTIQSRK